MCENNENNNEPDPSADINDDDLPEQSWEERLIESEPEEEDSDE